MTPKNQVLNSKAGSQILNLLLRQRNFLGALEVMHQELGDIFQIPLPGFRPFVLVGPEANRFVLATGRQSFRWRSERDPVTRLLRHGLLVEDGEIHDLLRRLMNQALHKRILAKYVEGVWVKTDQVLASWGSQNTLDMLVEMRKIALLVLMETLYGVDFSYELPRLWSAILKSIEFISPGLWILWPEMPRPGYYRAIQQINEYLYRIIADRRRSQRNSEDLLGVLVASNDLSDELVRDQLLTMLIAGHDTSTALLTWILFLLGKHPYELERLCQEVDEKLGPVIPTIEQLENLKFLNQVILETARLYPPIHVGNRIAAEDLEFQGVQIPAGSRVMYSIYLTHRHPRYWPEPERFVPDRFVSGISSNLPYTYVPFGGGPRNCIGMAFAQLEVKIILSRLLQKYRFELLTRNVRPYMGATLEPRPGVWMKVYQRI